MPPQVVVGLSFGPVDQVMRVLDIARSGEFFDYEYEYLFVRICPLITKCRGFGFDSLIGIEIIHQSRYIS